MNTIAYSLISSEGTDTNTPSRLLEFIIQPVLSSFRDYKFDFISLEEKDLMENIDDIDFCIADITGKGEPAFFYQLGQWSMTGKPFIVFQSSSDGGNTSGLTGISNILTYNLDDVKVSFSIFKDFSDYINQLLNKGFSGTKRVDLSAIYEKLEKIEKMISQGGYQTPVSISAQTPVEWMNTDPDTLFRAALVERNPEKAEVAMDRLKSKFNELKYYDLIVEQAAAIGSDKAGKMLIDYAEDFMKSDMSIKKKEEYLGCLVSYLNRKDLEKEYSDTVDKIAQMITTGPDGEMSASAYNQLNRLHYGIYATTDEQEELFKAIDFLKKAINIDDTEPSYHYNYSLCLHQLWTKETDEAKKGELIEEAVYEIERALENKNDEQQDADHISLACKLYYQSGRMAGFKSCYEQLKTLNYNKAVILANELHLQN